MVVNEKNIYSEQGLVFPAKVRSGLQPKAACKVERFGGNAFPFLPSEGIPGCSGAIQSCHGHLLDGVPFPVGQAKGLEEFGPC